MCDWEWTATWQQVIRRRRRRHHHHHHHHHPHIIIVIIVGCTPTCQPRAKTVAREVQLPCQRFGLEESQAS
jgi:hypothetical protein